MTPPPPGLKIKLQLYCGSEIAMGPGKADLLEAIAGEGSISAAGRALGMSYRRAWLLVDAMNRCWAQPLVATSPGAPSGAGARLTPFGADVVAGYRQLQRSAEQACAVEPGTWLIAGLRPAPLVHQRGG